MSIKSLSHMENQRRERTIKEMGQDRGAIEIWPS